MKKILLTSAKKCIINIIDYFNKNTRGYRHDLYGSFSNIPGGS